MRFVRNAMTALYPSSDEGGPGIDQTGLEDFLERYRQEAPAGLYVGLLASSALFELSPMLTVKRPTLASRLSPELREAHAEAITGHSIYLVRQSMFMLKLAAGLCWGADEGVRARMNLGPYEPDPGSWRKS